MTIIILYIFPNHFPSPLSPISLSHTHFINRSLNSFVSDDFSDCKIRMDCRCCVFFSSLLSFRHWCNCFCCFTACRLFFFRFCFVLFKFLFILFTFIDSYYLLIVVSFVNGNLLYIFFIPRFTFFYMLFALRMGLFFYKYASSILGEYEQQLSIKPYKWTVSLFVCFFFFIWYCYLPL